MTEPDVIRKVRNMLLVIAPSAAAVSAGCAKAAGFWDSPFDYWLIWAALVSGFAVIPSAVAAVIAHGIYLESLRSN